MPKIIPKSYYDSLIEVISKFTDGASISAIIDVLPTPPPKRTLQYHLSVLLKQGLIACEGKGVARRYHASVVLPSDSKETTPGADLHLSNQSLRIKDSVSGAVNTRKPVGYRRDFLYSYRPNETFYLPADVRASLAKAGTIAGDEQTAGTYLLKIYNRLMIDLSWNSSRLEGNTYSLLETERLLEAGERAEGRNAEEAQMIINHKAAIELLFDSDPGIGFNRYTICNLHAILSENLLSDPSACGRLRTRAVGITGTVFHPLETPQAIEECLDLVLEKAESIHDPFEQAFFGMVQMPYLQPFEDVNKRVSRLAANIPFMRMKLCPLSFIDVPLKDYVKGMLGVYELNAVEYIRDVFVWAYRRSCSRYSAVRQSLGEPDLFRMKYRNELKSIVYEVVSGRMSKIEAIEFIKGAIPDMLSAGDRQKFMEIVETELTYLHEGSIARYRLKPSQYENWANNWHQ